MTQHIKSHNSEADPEIKRGGVFVRLSMAGFTICSVRSMRQICFKRRICRRGVRVERSLNADRLTWTVSVYLPVRAHLPRTHACYRQRVWR